MAWPIGGRAELVAFAGLARHVQPYLLSIGEVERRSDHQIATGKGDAKMLLDPTTLDLSHLDEPMSAERAARPEWFERLLRANGDGAYLPNPIRSSQPSSAEMWGDN
jgi:hypothetical protein